MSDAMEKDGVCNGCINYNLSYRQYPCKDCSRAFSGMQKDWYEVRSNYPGKVIKVKTIADIVKKPSHYKICDMEAIEIMKMAMSPEELKGYIFGNILKYRLRAGKKGGMENTQEDIQKALQYEEMYERYFD